MDGALGERIGEGASADVHAWAPGRVVKLFRASVPRRIPWWEARMTRVRVHGGRVIDPSQNRDEIADLVIVVDQDGHAVQTRSNITTAGDKVEVNHLRTFSLSIIECRNLHIHK